MTPYEKVLYSLSKAEEKYPESYVAVEISSGKIIAHSKNLDKVLNKNGINNKKVAIGRKTPDNYYGFFDAAV